MKYSQSTLIALAFVFLVCSCGGGGGGGGGGAPIANPDAENAIALETTVGSPAEPSGGAPVIDDAIEGMVKFPLATVTGSASYKYIHPGTLHQYDAAGSFIEGRTVTLESFYISDHEVTQKEFFEVRGYNPARFKDSPDGSEVQEERPVENVNWYEALEYCNEKSRLEGLEPCYVIRGTTDIEKWKPLPPEDTIITCNWDANGYRLPTVLEWEYAARGGSAMSTTLYAGSNDLEEVAWCGTNSGNKTHQVKMREPNALGLYDMSGNVAEWCWDIKHTVTAETPLRSDAYDSQRFFCGGSWNTDENAVVAARSHTTAAYRPNERGWGAVGFRVARSKK